MRAIAKQVAHREIDTAKLGKPRLKVFAPAIKLWPKQSLTVRCSGGKWDLAQQDNNYTYTLSLNTIMTSTIDYVPKFLTVRALRFYTIRQPVGQAVPNAAHQYKLILSFLGCWTSGTADGDANLYDQLFVTELTPTLEGRQMIPYYLSGRDQQFVFQHNAAPTMRAFHFVQANFNSTDFHPSAWDDIVCDVDVTRWAYASTVLSLERTPKQLSEIQQKLKALGLPVRKDVTLCLPSGNNELAEVDGSDSDDSSSADD